MVANTRIDRVIKNLDMDLKSENQNIHTTPSTLHSCTSTTMMSVHMIIVQCFVEIANIKSEIRWKSNPRWKWGVIIVISAIEKW